MREFVNIPCVMPVEVATKETIQLSHVDLPTISTEKFRGRVKTWLRGRLIWLIEKLGLGQYRTELYRELPYYDYVSIEFDTVAKLVETQVCSLQECGIEPGMVLMGYDTFRRLQSELDPKLFPPMSHRLIEFPVELHYARRLDFSYFRLESGPFASNGMRELVEQMERYFTGASRVRGGTDFARNRLSFQADFLYGLPILVVPWLVGAVVVPAVTVRVEQRRSRMFRTYRYEDINL